MLKTVFFKESERKKLDKRIDELKEQGWEANGKPKSCVIDGVKGVYQVVCKPK